MQISLGKSKSLVPNWDLKMIGLLLSLFVLIAAVSLVYLWVTIDNIVNQVLYEFGLQFSYDWANPYWMFLRVSMVLLGLIIVAALMNITYFFWKKLKEPVLVTRMVKRVEKENEDLQGPPGASLYQCTSCGRSVAQPLKIDICPFCNATVVPASYVYTH